jgi:PAS domain S-box-containing protein
VKVDQPLRVLHLEDNARDAELVRDLLEAGGVVCDITRVQTREEFVASLQNGFDVILADYSLPSFDGLSALKIAALRSPDVPFIFVSGALGEELAIEALKTGATDYVLKERPSSLVPSVQRALREARERLERKRAEEALRASEARFRTFVDHATDAFFLMDEHLTVIDVNRRACESLGYNREELLGIQPRDIDAALDDASIARLAERAGAGETLTFETLHRRKDGTELPVEIRSHKFEQGGRQFYLALARDITERKRAEEDLRATELRFRTVVDFAADAFMVHAEDGKVIDVNQQACENLGYTRKELIGMMPAEFDADLDLDALRRVAERVGAGETVTVDTHHRRKDGTVFPVEVRVRQVPEGDRWIGISLSRDVTERKRGEEERERLHRLEADLARANRLTTMGELTASIAHEVSQPLGAMVASAGACARWLAADPPAMAEARLALDNIVADGKRAREVIVRIRELTKRQVPRSDLLDLNRKILEVLAFTERELRSHDIVLETRLDSTLPKVTGDRVQLQQVLLNLIVNAIEAMGAVNNRPRELTIVSARGTDGVEVEVRDSGIGLDPHRAEQVFEAFYTTKTEGIGIGLSISRSIVEAHGGRLWAAPNEPHGAVFRFSLPVAEDGQS